MGQITLAKSGVIDANGALTISLRPDSRRPWEIQQVASLAPNVGANSSAQIFRNGTPVTALGPRNGTASGLPYVTLRPAETMTVVYANGTPGALVTVNFLYDDGTD